MAAACDCGRIALAARAAASSRAAKPARADDERAAMRDVEDVEPPVPALRNREAEDFAARLTTGRLAAARLAARRLEAGGLEVGGLRAMTGTRQAGARHGLADNEVP